MNERSPEPGTDPRMLSRPRGSTLGALAEQVGARARRVAGGLADLGVRPGDRVAVCMANSPDVLVTYHAVWRLGAAVTPPLFLLSEDELRHALGDSGAAVVVTTPEFLPKVGAAARELHTRVVVAGAASEGVASL